MMAIIAWLWELVNVLGSADDAPTHVIDKLVLVGPILPIPTLVDVYPLTPWFHLLLQYTILRLLLTTIFVSFL
jgi:hypothetical protein